MVLTLIMNRTLQSTAYKLQRFKVDKQSNVWKKFNIMSNSLYGTSYTELIELPKLSFGIQQMFLNVQY